MEQESAFSPSPPAPRPGQSRMDPEPHGDSHARDPSSFHGSPFLPRLQTMVQRAQGVCELAWEKYHIFIFINSLPQ